jgi:hypothetical protein
MFQTSHTHTHTDHSKFDALLDATLSVTISVGLRCRIFNMKSAIQLQTKELRLTIYSPSRALGSSGGGGWAWEPTVA